MNAPYRRVDSPCTSVPSQARAIQRSSTVVIACATTLVLAVCTVDLVRAESASLENPAASRIPMARVDRSPAPIPTVLDSHAPPLEPRGGDLTIDLGRGPVTVFVPASYQPGTPAPLVMLLHGGAATGDWQESYMHFLPLSEEFGFLYVHPDGTLDQAGTRFWNATDACCDWYHSGVDDTGYLRAVIDTIKQQLDVDPRRVYLIGHSNGAFMSYRMACDHSETIAAIASLAGATYYHPEDCAPDVPVNVLQIHGTADSIVPYAGGSFAGVPFPGAIASTEQWASFAGCSLLPDVSAPPIDLDALIPGNETTVRRYRTNCSPEGSGELWSIQGGGHSPTLSSSFSRLIIEYLLAHPKPAPAALDDASVAPELTVRAYPNPFVESIDLSFQLSGPWTLTVEVINAAGQHVRTLLASRALPAGHHAVRWDGRADAGERVASGLYFVRLAGNRITRAIKLIRMD